MKTSKMKKQCTFPGTKIFLKRKNVREYYQDMKRVFLCKNAISYWFSFLRQKYKLFRTYVWGG